MKQSILQLMLMMLVWLGLGRVAHHRLLKANAEDARRAAADADDARRALPEGQSTLQLMLMILLPGLLIRANAALHRTRAGRVDARHTTADADDARRVWSERQSILQLMLMMLAGLGQSGEASCS